MKLAILIGFALICGTANATQIEECLLAPTGRLATVAYRPCQSEKSFYQKLPAAKGNADLFPASVEAPVNAYVSWFGIVRDVFTSDSWPKGKTWLVQVLYSDGFTDEHLQTVSINGPGNAFVFIDGPSDNVIPLMLVRFYGTVRSYTKAKVPRIEAEFVRYWPWGMFNFRDRGEDHSSPIWRQGTLVGQVRTYTGLFIDMDYYVQRIGGTDEQIQAQSDWHEKNRMRIKEWIEKRSPEDQPNQPPQQTPASSTPAASASAKATADRGAPVTPPPGIAGR